MLYIFLVDTGSMLTFDMNLAVGSVASLKRVITSKCKVSEDKQVLLISGGESLRPASRVCSYSAAGTDTSPIFLFSKTSIEALVAPNPMTDYGPDLDMKERVESCLDMEPTYNTVVSRAELAKTLYEMATQQLHVCERLVHDQHLQHQGWRAVVANLEDIIKAFSESSLVLEKSFAHFLESKPHHLQLLENHDLDLMSRIPILPVLLEPEKGLTEMSLLQWISQKDNQSSLEQIASQCLASLERFNDSSLDDIREEAKGVLNNADSNDMKEIKGLEERLYGLEKLMCEAKKIASDQSDLSNALYQNQQRASNLRDPSIFPDLCKSHQTQLQLMLKNHQQLRDIRRRCVQAKKELSTNIHARLRWIMFVEKKLADVDSKLGMYRENIRRLKRHLEVVEQINVCPTLYLSAVVEVVRRRNFSDHFIGWASALAKRSSGVHSEELETRTQFTGRMNNHFLRTLFPGMADIPPAYAVTAPEPFDLLLPKLSLSDIEYLRGLLPELHHILKVPLEVPLSCSSFDSSRKLTEKADSEESKSDEKLSEAKEIESETEEFETVNEEATKQEDEEQIKPDVISLSENTAKGSDSSSSVKNESGSNEFTGQMASVIAVPPLESNSTATSLHFADIDQLYSNVNTLTEQLLEANIALRSTQADANEKEIKLSSNSFVIESLFSFTRDCIANQRKNCLLLNDYTSLMNKEVKEIMSEIQVKFNDCLNAKNGTIEELQATFNSVVTSNESQVKHLQENLLQLKQELESAKDTVLESRLEMNTLSSTHEQQMEQLKADHEQAVKQFNLERELELEEEVKKAVEPQEEAVVKLQATVEKLQQENQQIQEEKERSESELLLRLQDEKDMLSKALREKFSEQVLELNGVHEKELQAVREENEKKTGQFIQMLDEDKITALKELNDRLLNDHKNEMESLRCRFKLAVSTTAIERTPDGLERGLSPDSASYVSEAKHSSLLQRELDGLRRKHEEELRQVNADREEEINALKSSLQAEKQVLFNETVNQVIREKEVLIRSLQAKEISLRSVIRSIRSDIQNKPREAAFASILKVLSSIDSNLEFAQLSESIAVVPRTESSCDQPINWEAMLRDRDSTIVRLQQQLSELPSSTSSAGNLDKVAVLSCEVGDVVLLCFVIQYDSYVVFSKTPGLHFLHTDSLEGLNLNTGPGESPRSWALAEVTDKEYCQAKKAQNRYNVAVGTRFYRVKAKPWSRVSNIRASMSASFAETSAQKGDATTAAAAMTSSCFPNINADNSLAKREPK